MTERGAEEKLFTIIMSATRPGSFALHLCAVKIVKIVANNANEIRMPRV